jgi:ABC-type nitrate/sulfonate/bicarbonate transport system ATPase subunit
LKGLVEHHLLQDLKEPLRHHPGQVSGGQRQRMAVLRAIIHNPRVVFADEPVSNLDLVNKTKMIHLLQAWQKGDLLSDNHQPRTLVLVCHEPETAWTLADDFLFLFPRKPGSDEPGPSHCVKLHREDLPGGAEDIRNRLQAGTALLDREHSASPASLSPSPG